MLLGAAYQRRGYGTGLLAPARRAAPVAGPALVANVPKSMTPIDLNAVQFTDKPCTGVSTFIGKKAPPPQGR